MKTGKEVVITAAIASLLVGGIATSGTAMASDLFRAKELKSGYKLASHHEEGEKKAAAEETKDHKEHEKKGHEKKAATEEEKKCGKEHDKGHEEKKCNAEKKCGEGSCGKKEKH